MTVTDLRPEIAEELSKEAELSDGGEMSDTVLADLVAKCLISATDVNVPRGDSRGRLEGTTS
ncbi:hypothetical protein ACQP2U_42830 (plasmid) [Nocardia sp. CA-084685]|uniref:hypothetical protein n=1 Tax=Nocardia sp. CA-084685 TaxID=3239970 RepID=UPI003D959A6A